MELVVNYAKIGQTNPQNDTHWPENCSFSLKFCSNSHKNDTRSPKKLLTHPKICSDSHKNDTRSPKKLLTHPKILLRIARKWHTFAQKWLTFGRKIAHTRRKKWLKLARKLCYLCTIIAASYLCCYDKHNNKLSYQIHHKHKQASQFHWRLLYSCVDG